MLRQRGNPAEPDWRESWFKERATFALKTVIGSRRRCCERRWSYTGRGRRTVMLSGKHGLSFWSWLLPLTRQRPEAG